MAVSSVHEQIRAVSEDSRLGATERRQQVRELRRTALLSRVSGKADVSWEQAPGLTVGISRVDPHPTRAGVVEVWVWAEQAGKPVALSNPFRLNPRLLVPDEAGDVVIEDRRLVDAEPASDGGKDGGGEPELVEVVEQVRYREDPEAALVSVIGASVASIIARRAKRAAVEPSGGGRGRA